MYICNTFKCGTIPKNECKQAKREMLFLLHWAVVPLTPAVVPLEVEVPVEVPGQDPLEKDPYGIEAVLDRYKTGSTAWRREAEEMDQAVVPRWVPLKVPLEKDPLGIEAVLDRYKTGSTA